MINNKKGISALLAIIVIVVVIVALVAVAMSLGSSPAASDNGDITVYIEGIKQTGNYSQPQPLNWGTISALNTYTRNYTVTNTGTQPYNLILLTTEPSGTAQSWPFNNTAIAAGTYSAGTLTLTLSATPAAGSYTWRLLASNGTMPTPTPTVNPSATPQPNTLSFTINADSNVVSIAMSKNNAPAYDITVFPQTFIFTVGDDFKFTPTYIADYTLNGWVFSDGSIPLTTPILTLQNIDGNFTVTCTSKYMPPA